MLWLPWTNEENAIAMSLLIISYSLPTSISGKILLFPWLITYNHAISKCFTKDVFCPANFTDCPWTKHSIPWYISKEKGITFFQVQKANACAISHATEPSCRPFNIVHILRQLIISPFHTLYITLHNNAIWIW